VTGKPIELRDGRYGLYVTDGETNASLPKDASGDTLTFEQAVSLLEARAAAGPSKKAKAKRGAKAPKAATKSPAKKAPAKKAPAKKGPVTKSATKKAPAKKSPAKKSATKKSAPKKK
jgi:DNA topoisomerase-1